MIRTLLTRRYETVRAVDGVSFSIEPGELVGYLGPNGAGKSTSVKMLTGVLVPTSGSVIVNGLVPWRDRTRHAYQIGAVFGQKTQLLWDLPLIESFALLRHVYQVDDRTYRQSMSLFSELLDLDELLSKPVRQLSLGERMRGDLAATLLHSPDVLLLDEPTIGLDVVVKERLREFLRELNRSQGITMILTTHDMGDVERLCQRLILIDHGIVLYDGAMDDFKASFGRYRILSVKLDRPVDGVSLEGCEVIRSEGNNVQFRFERELFSPQELIARLSAKYSVVDLTVEEPHLESIVRDVYSLPSLDRQEVLSHGGIRRVR
jgi:ABC-2 type transport system ATP-binding protein